MATLALFAPAPQVLLIYLLTKEIFFKSIPNQAVFTYPGLYPYAATPVLAYAPLGI